jgi:hypothetical protein
MVKVAPTFVHTPPEEKLTVRPELAVAATVKLVVYTALAGAGVVTLIVWLANCAVTDSVTSGAVL